MRMFEVDYIGHATVDKRLSAPMFPWILAQIHRGLNKKKILISVDNCSIVGQMGDGEISKGEQVFSHPLSLVSRLTLNTADVVSFFYVVRLTEQPLVVVHLFQTPNPDDVMELFGAMREHSNRANSQTRSLSNASSLTTLCPDISPSSSHFFEVLYIGKIKVSYKKVQDTFIDDALDKFHKLEQEKKEKEAVLIKNTLPHEVPGNPSELQESQASFGSTEGIKAAEATDGVAPQSRPMRKRSGSAGSILIKKSEPMTNPPTPMQENRNRTMVFLVGRSDLRLISPDKKQVLLHKLLKDITHTTQGSKHSSHFAFISKEMNTEPVSYIGYVFKCESKSVAEDVVTAISQALQSETAKKTKEANNNSGVTVVSCDHCPMVWFHKLCSEIEGLTDKAAQVTILRRLELLPEEEQNIVQTKLQGAIDSSNSLKEQTELFMMILRAHCESKQSRHVHDTPENRHEFLTHYLGGGAIFMKAKRSLTNSFDQLLKRKGSRDDFGPILKEHSLPANTQLCKEQSGEQGKTLSFQVTRPLEDSSSFTDPDASPAGSMMNIFLKVGNSPGKTAQEESEKDDSQPASWRQAIFKTVVTPSKTLAPKINKDGEFYRALWKKAINQQLLLIRMEKENARLTAHQEVANVKRIKLEYDDLGVRENSDVWELIMTKEHATQDRRLLLQALKQGIPRSKRGEVWLFMADNFRLKNPPYDAFKFPNYHIPYDCLLKQLTSHQHAILIDLGRTFPQHPYYSSPLGPGQLALFNILKAYSLLDPEVGYCQGLSFIAAVLLLHVTEEQAYLLLKHLMFRRGMRTKYLPDMAALQVHLYQLSRLLHDQYPELYQHLDKYEVAPTLYAAPWLLTVFSSQFPLGFVTWVFDVIFAESTDVLFRVAITLLGYHKDGLLTCDSFESIMDYFKHKLPDINKDMMGELMLEVLNKDISKELNDYLVEYHVLQEEMSSPRPETKKIKQLEYQNKSLSSQNKALSEQLQIASSNINRLENWRSSHVAQLSKLESQIRSLEVTVSVLCDFITDLAYSRTDVELPSEILRIMTQFNVSETRKKSLGQTDLFVKQEKLGKLPTPLKVALSSPNLTARMSSIFNSKSGNRLSPNEETKVTMKKSYSDTQEIGAIEAWELVKSKSTEEIDLAKFGRVLTDFEKKTIGSRGFKTETGTVKEEKIKEEGKSPSERTKLPLDSDGVSISFEGTTKLKSIKSARSRTNLETLKIIEDTTNASIDQATQDQLRDTIEKVNQLFDKSSKYDQAS